MIHKRIITIKGDNDWIKRTLQNSLPEGINTNLFGADRSIAIETVHGEPLFHDLPKNKPELRFETEITEKIHFLVFDDGFGSFKIERASFDGQKINEMIDAYNGKGKESGLYFATSIDLE